MGQNIKIIIAKVEYSIEVQDEQEEQAMRVAAQKVNDLVLEYQQVFEGVDKQMALSMTALRFAYNSEFGSLKDDQERVIALEKIKKLTELVDKNL